MTSRWTRIGWFALLAAILTAGICGGAEADKGRVHRARSSASEARAMAPAEQQVGLGPMRYYGGPKSPMSRAPAEN